jgi:histone deacetylase 1/2
MAATDHLTNNLDKLTMQERYHGKDHVQTANGTGMRITHIGQSIIPTSSHPLYLKNILHVPYVTRNLLSVKRFTSDNNVFFEFHPWYFLLRIRIRGRIFLEGNVVEAYTILMFCLQSKPSAVSRCCMLNGIHA